MWSLGEELWSRGLALSDEPECRDDLFALGLLAPAAVLVCDGCAAGASLEPSSFLKNLPIKGFYLGLKTLSSIHD